MQVEISIQHSSLDDFYHHGMSSMSLLLRLLLFSGAGLHRLLRNRPSQLPLQQSLLRLQRLPSFFFLQIGCGVLVGASVVGLLVGAGVVSSEVGGIVGALVGTLVGASVGASVGGLVGGLVGELVWIRSFFPFLHLLLRKRPLHFPLQHWLL